MNKKIYNIQIVVAISGVDATFVLREHSFNLICG